MKDKTTIQNAAVLLVILLMLPASALATAQQPDVLNYKGKTYSLFSNPLEGYYENRKDRSFSSLSMIAVVFLSVVSVSSQTKPRVVQWDETRVSVKMSSVHSEAMDQIDGLEITDVTAGGKSITLGQPFAGDDEWLKTLGVKIKNVSSVEISVVQLSLFLPQLMPGGPLVALCHGCGGVGMGETISPGEEVEVKLVLYDWLVGQINAKSSLSVIDKAEIWNISVTLADGKKWSSGCMKTVDAKNACPKPKQ